MSVQEETRLRKTALRTNGGLLLSSNARTMIQAALYHQGQFSVSIKTSSLKVLPYPIA